MTDHLNVDNGASTGTSERPSLERMITERAVPDRMIKSRDVGKIDGIVLYLFQVDSEASWNEAGVEMRHFIEWWNGQQGQEFMFLYIYLYEDPKDVTRGFKALGADPLTRNAVRFVWEGCIGSAAAKLEAFDLRLLHESRTANAYVNPPKSGIAKSLEARKAPPFGSYSDKNEDSKWSFIRALAPSLSSPLVSVEEGRALLGTLMSERGTSFLTSHGCLTAQCSVELLGALMMEVERVDSVAQLRVRVFCADQRQDESLLEFIDRVADRHQIFCIAYPEAVRDEIGLLNRVIMCMDTPDYGVQMIMRNAANLAEARELIRTLNLPSLYTKPPAKNRGGVYAVTTGPPPGGLPKVSTDQSDDHVSMRADMSAMNKKFDAKFDELIRTVASQSKSIGQLTHNSGNRGGGISSGLCFECNEPGHLGRDCPKRHARHAQEKAKREAQSIEEAAMTKVNPDFV